MRAERTSDIRADVGPNLLIAGDPRRVDSAQPRTNRKRKLLFKVNVNPRYNTRWGEDVKQSSNFAVGKNTRKTLVHY